MEAILYRRRALKGKITRIEKAVAVPDNQQISSQVVAMYRPQLVQLRTELDEIHNELNALCDDDAFVVQQAEYDALTGRMEAQLLKFPEDPVPIQQNDATQNGANVTAVITTPTAVNTNVRLPRLELPTFGGNFYDWSSFHDLFSATIVDNERLTGAQKLQYLKTSLHGEAASLLHSLQVTDDNFTEAWEILRNRYHNRREIINAHLKRLCSQPTLAVESPSALRQLIDTTNETVRALRVLKVPVEHWDIMLVHLVAERLDADSRRQWELSLTDTEVPSYADFIKFLEQRARALMTCNRPKFKVGGKMQERKGPNAAVHHVNTSSKGCKICKGHHQSYKCSELLESSVEDRRNMVRTHNLCYNCLADDHQCNQCKAGSCRKCKGKHHTLLHVDKRPATVDTVGTHDSYHGTLNNPSNNPSRVLLATAVVKIRDAYGSDQLCRALLDSGSQATFVTENCAQRLGLPRTSASVVVSGLSCTNVHVSRGAISLQVTSNVDPTVQFKRNAFVLKKVTSTMPMIECDKSAWSHLPSRRLADPEFHVPRKVDVLLGADVLAEVLREGLRRGPLTTPVAQESGLGWLVSGTTGVKALGSQISVNHAQIDLTSSVQRFWELEESPTAAPLTVDQARCEEHFIATHQRSDSGRFIVRLPFKPTEFLMEPKETRHIAVRRLHQLERQLQGNSRSDKEYQDFLREYEGLNHMKRMTKESDMATSVYLPHHAVVKESSTTTRVRVVFDASAKGRNGLSLNDHMLTGPTIQEGLFTILVRFRTHAIAMTADINKMYRQVRVHEDDLKFQNIVWRETTDQPIQDFQLLTLTYGTASAPYLATRCLQQLALDEECDFPKAAAVIKKDFYVDDLLTGTETVKDALAMQQDLITVLSRGGFDLHKWSSNSTAVIKAVPAIKVEKQSSRELDPNDTVNTLGLRWIPTTDEFTFTLDFECDNATATKRSVLSTLAKVFDPLGWLAPITIRAKLLLQTLWRRPCNWDDSLPSDVNEEWMLYMRDLNQIENLRIPRRLTSSDAVEYHLHGFCDASERAYAAAIYLQVFRTLWCFPVGQTV